MPSVVVADLLDVFSFKSKAACVNMLMGLLKSVVLSTLLSAKFVLAAATVLAPVPPFAIVITPVIVTPATAASTYVLTAF